MGSIIQPPATSAALRKVQPRLQVVATGGQIPVNVTPSGTGTGYTRSEGNFKFQIGPQRVRGLRYAFANFYNTTGGETDGIDVTLAASLLTGGAARQLGINGVKNPSVNAGSAFVVTDPYWGDLDAGAVFNGRSGAVYASGVQVPGGRQIKWGAGSENFYDSSAASSQVYSTTTLTLPSGGATSAYGFGPTAILGVPDKPHPAVCIYGDSIAYGQNDSGDGAGQKGMFERGLAGVYPGAVPLPYVNVSRSGDVLTSNGTTGTGPYYPNKGRLRQVFEWCTDVLVTLGTNDLGSTTSNVSLASMQAAALSIVAAARGAGCRVHFATILPHTTDASNAAVYVPTGSGDATAFTAGGKRAQYNAWLKTIRAAGTIDGVVDVCAALEDPNTYGFWISSGHTDSLGLHPDATYAALAGAVVKSWAQGLT